MKEQAEKSEGKLPPHLEKLFPSDEQRERSDRRWGIFFIILIVIGTAMVIHMFARATINHIP